MQNLFSQRELCPFCRMCLEVQRNPSKFRAALYYFCQCLQCTLGLCRKAKRVFQEEWDEHIAEICELEVTRALKETSVAGLQCERMRVNIESGPPVEPEPTIKMRILGTLKLILWVTHAGRCCYPGLFQNFCNSEKEAVQKLLCWYK